MQCLHLFKGSVRPFPMQAFPILTMPPRASSSPASHGLKKGEAGGEMVEDTLVGWDFHDRGPLKTLRPQYLQHTGTVQVAGVHTRVGPAAAGLLEMHNFDHICWESLQFRQRVAVRIAPELVGWVWTQPQVLAFVWCKTSPSLPHYQGHAANGLAGVLHRQDDPLPGRLPR